MIIEEEEKKEACRPSKIDSNLIYNWHAKQHEEFNSDEDVDEEVQLNLVGSFKPGKEELKFHESSIKNPTRDFAEKNKRKLPADLAKNLEAEILEAVEIRRKQDMEMRASKIEEAKKNQEIQN